MPDDEKLAAVRAALPAVDAGIYLNAGSVGPLPAETAKAMADLEAWELRTGRAHVDYFEELLARMDEARGAVAAVLGTDVDAVALNHSTTDGMNQAIGAVDWRPGDKAVSTRLEHAGGVGPLHALHARLGIELELVDAGPDDDDGALLAAFDAAITPGTRVVEMAHVSPMTGALLPVAAIAELAHVRGALLVVDGAQAAGAMPVDVPASGADFYAIPAHKWLLGPEGMGALVVAPGLVERLYPAAAGAFSFESFDPRGTATFWPDARRFDGAGFNRPSVVGMARSIGWLSMYVGLDWIHRRGQALARAAAGRLAAIPGVEVVTPRERMATLVTFRIVGWPASTALDELGARVFAIARTIGHLDALRISVGFWATEEELERFAEAVELLAAHTPESIPARRTLTILGQDA
jgi:L-cysteine/cystine lyase